jgi:hypothetical protein
MAITTIQLDSKARDRLKQKGRKGLDRHAEVEK